MTPQEALDAIGRLCDEREHGPGPGWVAVDEVRAVLAEPGPAVPAQGTVIHEEPGQYRIDRWVDDDGPAVPAHDIDRDAASIVDEEFDRVLTDDTANIGWVHDLPVYTQERLGHLRRIILERLALVEPVDGVILSPDEVALARSWYTRLPIGVSPDDVALAARLEASS